MPLAIWRHCAHLPLLALLLSSSALAAQGPGQAAAGVPPKQARPPLVGTISPQAGQVAAPATTPSVSTSRNWEGKRAIRTRPLGPGVYIPLLVRDAPVYQRGVSTLVVAPVSTPVVSEPAFYPTPAAPSWRIVPEDHPVQGWRLVDVDDVICYPTGHCRAVTTRVVARWIPMLRGYGFRDRVGRVWRVE